MINVDVSYRAKMYDKNEPTQIKGIILAPKYADLLAYGIKRYAISKANLFDIVTKINETYESNERFEVGAYSVDVTKFEEPKKIQVTDKFMKYSAVPVEMAHKIIYKDMLSNQVTVFCRRKDIISTIEELSGKKADIALKDVIKNNLITKAKFTVDMESKKVSPFTVEFFNVADLFILERGDDI
jgi:hypothetical protein